MPLFNFVYFFVIGLIVGSFIGAYTFRWQKGISVLKGRSFCPKCNKTILWYDNIPLLSFVLLKGCCRFCKKNISLRYPLIELATGLIFSLIFFNFLSCNIGLNNETVCFWREKIGILALPYFLLVAFFLISIFVTDFEGKIIPDELSYFLFFLTTLALIISPPSDFFLRLFCGFLIASIFLFLNLITRGRGMGFGDSKLVLFAGVFDWRKVLVWIYLSFIIGALVGVLLLLVGKTKFGRQIAFGPFLVIGFFVTLFWGEALIKFFLPYLV